MPDQATNYLNALAYWDGSFQPLDFHVRGARLYAGRTSNAVRDRDLKNALVIPAFYNPHTHTTQTRRRNRLNSLPLEEWLVQVFKDRADCDAAQRASSIHLTGALMLEAGICAAGVQDEAESAMLAYRLLPQMGITVRVFVGMNDHDEAGRLLEEIDIIDSWYRRLLAESSGLFPGPWGLPASSLQLLQHMKSTYGLIHTHAHENESSHRRNDIESLYNNGLLDQNTTLVHCVRLLPGNLQQIAESGAQVVHCPRSNAYLGIGVMPLADFLQNGVRIGLGTDGLASNFSCDMFEEMRAAYMFAKACSERSWPKYALEKSIFDMATISGAIMLGIKDGGALGDGKLASFLALDMALDSEERLGLIRHNGHTAIHNQILSRIIHEMSNVNITLFVSQGQIVRRKNNVLGSRHR